MIRKLTVPEYATLMKVSPPTVYRRIKADKLETETIDGILHVIVDDSQYNSDEEAPDLISELQERLKAQQAEIEYLRQELSKAHEELAESRQRSDTIILQFTRQFDEQTKLLEDMRQDKKPNLFQRIFSYKKQNRENS
jgi:hypothetical protein